MSSSGRPGGTRREGPRRQGAGASGERESVRKGRATPAWGGGTRDLERAQTAPGPQSLTPAPGRRRRLGARRARRSRRPGPTTPTRWPRVRRPARSTRPPRSRWIRARSRPTPRARGPAEAPGRRMRRRRQRLPSALKPLRRCSPPRAPSRRFCRPPRADLPPLPWTPRQEGLAPPRPPLRSKGPRRVLEPCRPPHLPSPPTGGPHVRRHCRSRGPHIRRRRRFRGPRAPVRDTRAPARRPARRRRGGPRRRHPIQSRGCRPSIGACLPRRGCRGRRPARRSGPTRGSRPRRLPRPPRKPRQRGRRTPPMHGSPMVGTPPRTATGASRRLRRARLSHGRRGTQPAAPGSRTPMTRPSLPVPGQGRAPAER